MRRTRETGAACPQKCGGKLVEMQDDLGQLTFECPACVRVANGHCRNATCSNRRDSRSPLCKMCRLRRDARTVAILERGANLRCERRHCGELLVERGLDAIGRMVYVCRPCERNRRGRCRDCPSPLVQPFALRCPACSRRQKTKLNTALALARYADDEQRKRILKKRRTWSRRKQVAAKRKAYQADYRAAHKRERDAFDRTYFREYARAWRADPVKRERANARRRKGAPRPRLATREQESAA